MGQAVYDKDIWAKTVEGGGVYLRKDPCRDAIGKNSRGERATTGGVENSEIATKGASADITVKEGDSTVMAGYNWG